MKVSLKFVVTHHVGGFSIIWLICVNIHRYRCQIGNAWHCFYTRPTYSIHIISSNSHVSTTNFHNLLSFEKSTNTTFSWTTYIHVWMASWFILILTFVKEEDYFYTNSLLCKENFMFQISTSHVRIYKSIYTYIWSNHYLT
jgi:hypothetical protein